MTEPIDSLILEERSGGPDVVINADDTVMIGLDALRRSRPHKVHANVALFGISGEGLGVVAYEILQWDHAKSAFLAKRVRNAVFPSTTDLRDRAMTKLGNVLYEVVPQSRAEMSQVTLEIVRHAFVEDRWSYQHTRGGNFITCRSRSTNCNCDSAERVRATHGTGVRIRHQTLLALPGIEVLPS